MASGALARPGSVLRPPYQVTLRTRVVRFLLVQPLKIYVNFKVQLSGKAQRVGPCVFSVDILDGDVYLGNVTKTPSILST